MATCALSNIPPLDPMHPKSGVVLKVNTVCNQWLFFGKCEQ